MCMKGAYAQCLRLLKCEEIPFAPLRAQCKKEEYAHNSLMSIAREEEEDFFMIWGYQKHPSDWQNI
jgi:hypothetical protein